MACAYLNDARLQAILTPLKASLHAHSRLLYTLRVHVICTTGQLATPAKLSEQSLFELVTLYVSNMCDGIRSYKWSVINTKAEVHAY